MSLSRYILFGLLSVITATSPRVTVTNGTIVGSYLSTFKQDFFGGVPYSASPVRFEPSVPRKSKFPGDLDARDYGPVCYGTDSAASGFDTSEDCLSLNVVRPANSTESSNHLPVVIWIHGGGFWGGSAADPQLNGSYIVKRSTELGTPIIFVSIQYRLLFYGFPSGNEAHSLAIENLGLRDQRLAFQWVQENIAAFGGDPSKVTLMGESAGGTGILQHLVAYGGRNDSLFRAAIVESGSFYDMPCNWNISDIREQDYQDLLLDAGCSDIACLKTLDNDVLFNVSLKYFAEFLPSIDGVFMQAHPVELFNDGNFLSVPLLMGVNNDEGTILVSAGSNTTSDIENALLELNASSYSIQEDSFPRLFDLYPDDPAAGVPMNTGSGLLSSGLMDKTSFLIFNDAVEHSVRRWITNMFAKAGNAVFSYRFTQVPWHALVSSGATHGTEITYVFGNTNPNISSPLGPRDSDWRLSQFMTASWVSFVHHLTPEPPSRSDVVLKWPEYGVAGQNLVFAADASFVEEDTYREEGIGFWIEQRVLGCVGVPIG